MIFDPNELAAFLLKEKIPFLQNEEMKRHTTFRIGGTADWFVLPESEAQIIRLCRYCKENRIPLTVVGNGSDLLVSDDGISGVTLCVGRGFSKIEPQNTGYTVEAGAPLAAVCRRALSDSLTGLEFACGIPGTVGGAIFMNAGAYGGEIKDVVSSVRALDRETGEVRVFSMRECGFAYRHSRFQQEPELVILSAEFSLAVGERDGIERAMQKNSAARKEKQPLEFPNAGSAFRRPADGRAAAAMIDACSLKGVSCGGAAVSEKHAGFFVNRGGATCADVTALLALVQKEVEKRFGVWLEPEYRMVGGRNGKE